MKVKIVVLLLDSLLFFIEHYALSFPCSLSCYINMCEYIIVIHSFKKKLFVMHTNQNGIVFEK